MDAAAVADEIRRQFAGPFDAKREPPPITNVFEEPVLGERLFGLSAKLKGLGSAPVSAARRTRKRLSDDEELIAFLVTLDEHLETIDAHLDVNRARTANLGTTIAATLAARRIAKDRAKILASLAHQLRRAWHHIRALEGTKQLQPVRRALWRSLFTDDPVAFLRWFADRPGDSRLATTPVFLEGETGTGKSMIASCLARSSYVNLVTAHDGDVGRLFVSVNLAGLAPSIVESELFGHVKGAFTGATEDKAGLLETVGEHGILFLDEIAAAPVHLQVKLLDALERRAVRRVGDLVERPFRGRLVVAANESPESLVESGRMREDFFYRICSVRITIPPLRSIWKDDGVKLAHLFAARLFVGDDLASRPAHTLSEDQQGFVARMEPNYLRLCTKVDEALRRRGADTDPWRGNVRELRQLVAAVYVGVDPPARMPGSSARLPDGGALEALERAAFALGREGPLERGVVAGGHRKVKHAVMRELVRGIRERPNGRSDNEAAKLAGANVKTIRELGRGERRQSNRR
ncbi:MAG: sigma 54-interacting transcriptional regulator [Deltaproteobacteria bacterium]|nr:sigma 54-interacting transcriptional regulator [Deltaproteobacteria bacterium]